MAENSSVKRMSISFTLPISCQICLGKVKQPIVCPNHHVFCSACIELWLQHNQQCPTCRVPITPENPCKQIIGGQNQENDSEFYMSNPALRRARFDILYQDCENEIKRLQQENETLKNSNCQLQEQLTDTEKALASKSGEIHNTTSAIPSPSPSFEATPKAKTWKDQSHPSPRSSPSAAKLKSKGRCQRDGGCSVESSRDDGSDNGEMLAALRSKLKQATSTYEKIKQDMDKLKEKNANLSSDNRALLMKNGHLKQAATTRSPRMYEKFTSMAQQSKLDQCRHEVAQLKSALERSDTYIEELETELQDYKSLFGSIPRKRPCRTEDTSGHRSPGITAAKPETVLTSKRRGETSKLDEARVPSTSSDGGFNHHDRLEEEDEADVPSTSSDRCFNHHDPLEEEDRLIFFGKGIRVLNGIEVKDTRMDPSAYTYTSSTNGKFREEVHQKLILSKKANHVLVNPKRRASTVGDNFKRVKEAQLDSDDASDLEEPSPFRNTPSTALERLSLDSSQKLQRLSSSFQSLSASLEPELKISPSCHRQLDFGKNPPENEAWQSFLGSGETKGLMLEGNSVDVGPLDQNVTFSDLNFTITSEFSDCAQLMKEAEKRVKNKMLSSREGEVCGTTQIPKSKDEVDKKPSAQQAVFRSMSPVNRDRENFKYFTPVTSSQDDGHNDQTANRGDYCKRNSLQNKSRNFNVNFDSDNTQVTWSKNRPDWRNMQRSAFTEPQEPVVYVSSTLTLTNAGLIRTSQSANYSSYSSCKSTSLGGVPSNASFPYTNTKQSTISQPSNNDASKMESTRAKCLQPTIKPQLTKLRHDADDPDLWACTNGRGTGSRFKLDAHCDRDTFDSVRQGPLMNEAGDRVTSSVRRPSSHGNALMEAHGLETKCFFPIPGQDGRQDGAVNESHKRIRLDQNSEDDDSDDASPNRTYSDIMWKGME